MANPPTQTPKPPPPPAPKPHDPPPPAAKVEAQAVSKDPQEAKLELAESAARDRKLEPPVKTIADEQRERSEEIMREGLDKWKAAHDERGAEDKPKVVPGIQQRPVEAHEIRR
jgi:hypothetical protein